MRRDTYLLLGIAEKDPGADLIPVEKKFIPFLVDLKTNGRLVISQTKESKNVRHKRSRQSLNKKNNRKSQGRAYKFSGQSIQILRAEYTNSPGRVSQKTLWHNLTKPNW